MQDICKKDGRKFGFINLPPLGCAPGIRIVKAENNGSCLEEASSLVKLHNKALSKLLRKLEKQLKGFKYSLYNFNINLRKRMNHPSKYGMSYRHIISFLWHVRWWIDGLYLIKKRSKWAPARNLSYVGIKWAYLSQLFNLMWKIVRPMVCQKQMMELSF